MTSPPERPWAGTSWETIKVVGPPWWRRPLTVAFAVPFALALLAPIALSVWLILQGHNAREASKTEFDRLGVALLTPGECVDESGHTDKRSLRQVSCSSLHDGEITGAVALSGGAYPGKKKVLQESDDLCSSATDIWILDGPGDDMDLDLAYFYPSLQGWAQGRPTTICYATAHSGRKIQGPLEAIR